MPKILEILKLLIIPKNPKICEILEIERFSKQEPENLDRIERNDNRRLRHNIEIFSSDIFNISFEIIKILCCNRNS